MAAPQTAPDQAPAPEEAPAEVPEVDTPAEAPQAEHHEPDLHAQLQADLHFLQTQGPANNVYVEHLVVIVQRLLALALQLVPAPHETAQAHQRKRAHER